jgi:hypothetical protein
VVVLTIFLITSELWTNNVFSCKASSTCCNLADSHAHSQTVSSYWNSPEYNDRQRYIGTFKGMQGHIRTWEFGEIQGNTEEYREIQDRKGNRMVKCVQKGKGLPVYGSEHRSTLYM